MERLVIALARRQKMTGHESVIYCTTHKGTLAPQAEEALIPVVEFQKCPGFSFRLLRDIARRLRVDRPDVLHTHNALVHHYGVAAARLARVPVVVNTRHGYGSLSWDARREGIYNCMVRWTDKIVLVSDGVRQYFVDDQHISKERTCVIQNGVGLDTYLRRPARPGAHRPVLRFGTVGRLAPPKDHISLVRAFAQVASRLPQAELHLLGDGECRPAIEHCIAEHHLQGRITLHGFSSDVAGFLSSLDVFVLSSTSEGLPLAVLEAMGAGLPIVSTRLPGIEDVAPEDIIAWYSEPGNPTALAESMLAASRHSDLTALGQTASSLARGYSIDETWRQYESLFSRLLLAKSAQGAWEGQVTA